MPELISVSREDDILPEHRGTPVADLLAHHNLNRPFREHAAAELLIVTCMDNRIMLRLPPSFAFVLRTAGANARGLDFNIAFAIAIGGVRAIAIIGHSRCAMISVTRRRNEFIQSLAERASCTPEQAGVCFDQGAPAFEIDDPATFTADQAERLGRDYPRIHIAPLFYDVDDGRLSQVVQSA